MIVINPQRDTPAVLPLGEVSKEFADALLSPLMRFKNRKVQVREIKDGYEEIVSVYRLGQEGTLIERRREYGRDANRYPYEYKFLVLPWAL